MKRFGRTRKVFNLKNGFNLDIAYHHGRKTLCASLYSTEHGGMEIYSSDIKDLFMKIREAIIELEDPVGFKTLQLMTRRISLEKYHKFIGVK